MNGKEHLRLGDECLKSVTQMVTRANHEGAFRTPAEEAGAQWVATLANLHFAAATAYALNESRVAVRSVTG